MIITHKSEFWAGMLAGAGLTSLAYDTRDVYQRNNGIIIRIKNES